MSSGYMALLVKRLTSDNLSLVRYIPETIYG